MASTYVEALVEDMEDHDDWLQDLAHHKVFTWSLPIKCKANHDLHFSGWIILEVSTVRMFRV